MLAKRGEEDTRGCKPIGGKELAGLRGRRRVICRANMIEVIILVYRLSSDFLSTCKFKIAKGLAQNLGLREKSKPCMRKGWEGDGCLGFLETGTRRWRGLASPTMSRWHTTARAGGVTTRYSPDISVVNGTLRASGIPCIALCSQAVGMLPEC